MKTFEVTTVTTWYRSEVHPELKTDRAHMKDAIAWADTNPVAWKVVLSHKSKEFGINGGHYFGSERGEGHDNTLARVYSLWAAVVADLRGGFFQWRAQFTLDHYGEKGFKSGFFQLWDGTYYRDCATLDYTPATLENVVDAFERWCDHSVGQYRKDEIHLDKKSVRTFVDGKQKKTASR